MDFGHGLLGLSITRGGLGRDLEKARPFLDWIDRLFGPFGGPTPTP